MAYVAIAEGLRYFDTRQLATAHARLKVVNALEFINGPLRSVVQDRSVSLTDTLKRLIIAAWRFERVYIFSADLDWHTLFDTDTSLNDRLRAGSPSDLAAAFTKDDIDSIFGLNPRAIMGNDEVYQRFGRRWNQLNRTVCEVLRIDSSQAKKMLDCAKVGYTTYCS